MLNQKYKVRHTIKGAFDFIDEEFKGLSIKLDIKYGHPAIFRIGENCKNIFDVENVNDYLEYKKAKSLFLSKDEYTAPEVRHVIEYLSAFTKTIKTSKDYINNTISLIIIDLYQHIYNDENSDTKNTLYIFNTYFKSNSIVFNLRDELGFYDCNIDTSSIESRGNIHLVRCKIRNSDIAVNGGDEFSTIKIDKATMQGSEIKGENIFILGSTLWSDTVLPNNIFVLDSVDTVQLKTYTDKMTMSHRTNLEEGVYDINNKRTHYYIKVPLRAGNVPALLYDLTAGKILKTVSLISILTLQLCLGSRKEKINKDFYLEIFTLEEFEEKYKPSDDNTLRKSLFLIALDYIRTTFRIYENNKGYEARHIVKEI